MFPCEKRKTVSVLCHTQGKALTKSLNTCSKKEIDALFRVLGVKYPNSKSIFPIYSMGGKDKFRRNMKYSFFLYVTYKYLHLNFMIKFLTRFIIKQGQKILFGTRQQHFSSFKVST